jgi:hypothetical protein
VPTNTVPTNTVAVPTNTVSTVPSIDFRVKNTPPAPAAPPANSGIKGAMLSLTDNDVSDMIAQVQANNAQVANLAQGVAVNDASSLVTPQPGVPPSVAANAANIEQAVANGDRRVPSNVVETLTQNRT